MKHFTRITTAALFGATMLAGPAFAQSDGNPSDAPSNVEDTIKVDQNNGTTAVDTNKTAAVESTFDSAMGMIGDSGSAATIKSMPDVGEVRIVSMGSLEYADKNRIEQAMSEKDAQVQELRAAISANPTITAELQSNNMAASDVIAADVAADGSVVVYTR